MQIHRGVALIGAIFFSAVAGFSQQAKKPSGEVPLDYSQEPFIVEQFHTRAHFENDGTGRRQLQVRIRVQSDAGVRQLGQLVFGYNSANERLDINSVQVRRSDGSSTTAPADAVQDMSSPVERNAPVYTDYRQKHLTVPGLRPGDTLAYQCTTTIRTPLAPGQFWLEYDFLKDAIVRDEMLEINVPRQRVIKLKTQPGAEPVISEEGDRRIYRWKRSRLRRGDEEKENSQSPKTIKKSDAPAIQLTTFQSWEEVGRWYAPLERERAVPTAAIRAKAEEIVRGRTTDLEKIEALYDYVAKNFRYVSLSFGLGRYQPHAPAEVLSNQYGDCKDKHTLLESLIEAIGLPAYPVLINSSRKIDAQMPSPAQFDHMITAVPQGKDWIWLDSTTEVAPFRMLSANLRKKQALIIPAGSATSSFATEADGTARLVETPSGLPFPATQHVDVEGQVSELGKLTARVRYTLRGDAELLLRMGFRRTPQNQWKQLGQLLAISDGFRGEVSDVKAGDPAGTGEPFRVEYRIALANYLDWSSKKSQVPVPLPALGLPAPEVDDKSEADAEPIDLGTPLEIVTRARLELPADYTARAPVAVAVMRDYAEYRSSYKVDGNKVTAERTLRFKMREVPAARGRDYLAFTRAIRSDEQQALALESKVVGGPAIPQTAKTEELFESAVAALHGGNNRVAAELFERVVAQEPKHKAAWNDLGLAQLNLHQLDAATRSFRKQIEVNPYDEHSYNNLGRALWQQERYDEAVEAFRKQIEINPLDRWAHANLGLLYGEQRKYDEAVPELDKAVALSPDNPALRIGLGRAYLNLGKIDEALAAFDKAVELAPSPGIWNDVAYNLSVKKVHLERAQQYAESAVTATAAELRNIALDRLRPEDLARVNILAASWDTLGWVHFQKGELAPAERYVGAAWLLAERGEAGDHLAQIYEKRGAKQEALLTYAEALAAARPVPESRHRLAALLGGEDRVKAQVEKVRENLGRLRTITLGKLLKESASAEFFVLLEPRSHADPNGGAAGFVGIDAKVEEVKFISGSEKLRALADALRASIYPATFPDDTPTKLVRRGILSCSATTAECVFVMLTPDQVTSIN